MRQELLKGRCFCQFQNHLCPALLVLGFMTKFVVDSTVVYLNIAMTVYKVKLFFAPKKQQKRTSPAFESNRNITLSSNYKTA